MIMMIMINHYIYIHILYNILERITRGKPFHNFEYFIQQAMILHITRVHRFAVSALQ